MTATESSGSAQLAAREARADSALNLVIVILVAALISLVGWFAYSVYVVQETEDLATPALRMLERFKEEVRVDPNSAAKRVRLAEAFASAGMVEEAIEQLNVALEIDENHVGAHLDLGLIAAGEGDAAAAEGYFTEVVDLTEGTEFEAINDFRENALYGLGLIALDQERFEESVGFFKEALRIRRDASDTYYHMALAFLGLDEKEAAIENLQIALSFDPNYAEANYQLGLIYANDGDVVRGSYHLRLAADIAPDADPPQEALESLGTYEDWYADAVEAADAGDLEKALQDVQVARNLDPTQMEAILLHAQLLEENEQPDQALKVYYEALELDPENEEALAAVERLEAAGVTPAE
jgi:tetratricopeptide (TPR) repeat protein